MMMRDRVKTAKSHAAGSSTAGVHAARTCAVASRVQARAQATRSRRRFAIVAWMIVFVGALFLLAPDITDFIYRANTTDQLQTVRNAAALAAGDDAPGGVANSTVHTQSG